MADSDTPITYSSKTILALYSLARMFYSTGLYSEAEKICLCLVSLYEEASPARLLLANLHFERGNFSLAANHYRHAAQYEKFSLPGRLGLLACYCGLKDYERASMLAQELEQEQESFSSEFNVFFQMHKSSILANNS